MAVVHRLLVERGLRFTTSEIVERDKRAELRLLLRIGLLAHDGLWYWRFGCRSGSFYFLRFQVERGYSGRVRFSGVRGGGLGGLRRLSGLVQSRLDIGGGGARRVRGILHGFDLRHGKVREETDREKDGKVPGKMSDDAYHYRARLYAEMIGHRRRHSATVAVDKQVLLHLHSGGNAVTTKPRLLSA